MALRDGGVERDGWALVGRGMTMKQSRRSPGSTDFTVCVPFLPGGYSTSGAGSSSLVESMNAGHGDRQRDRTPKRTTRGRPWTVFLPKLFDVSLHSMYKLEYEQ